MPSLMSSTALALVLSTAVSPLAAASRIAPHPVPELPGPSVRAPYRVTRLPPSTPVSNTTFAKPPADWVGTSSDGSLEVAPAPIVVTKAAVRAALEQARKDSLAAFQTYLSSQVYPSNTYKKGALNVWRDDAGHYCAAATIIRISGRIAISEKVPNTNNNLRLINVKDGALMDWILTSGLTQQEIDRIQMPFIDVQPDGPRKMPPYVVGIDAQKKTAETARLLKAYRTTYAALLKSNKASLDLAVNRLMAHPDLARDFLDGSLAARDVH